MKVMVAKNVDHHRYTYTSGIKAVETSKWGIDKAAERYGEPAPIAPNPPDHSGPQAPEYAQGPKYHNDTPDDWRRAAGEDATTKPNFDKQNPWRKGGK